MRSSTISSPSFLSKTYTTPCLSAIFGKSQHKITIFGKSCTSPRGKYTPTNITYPNNTSPNTASHHSKSNCSISGYALLGNRWQRKGSYFLPIQVCSSHYPRLAGEGKNQGCGNQSISPRNAFPFRGRKGMRALEDLQ